MRETNKSTRKKRSSVRTEKEIKKERERTTPIWRGRINETRKEKKINKHRKNEIIKAERETKQ
jgi:hypothetical protein